MPRRPQQQYSAPASRKAGTKRDVAFEHGVSLRTVDTWISRHLIPYKKYGARLIRFDLDKVAAALDRFEIREVK
jgi:hypothetical protein